MSGGHFPRTMTYVRWVGECNQVHYNGTVRKANKGLCALAAGGRNLFVNGDAPTCFVGGCFLYLFVRFPNPCAQNQMGTSGLFIPTNPISNPLVCNVAPSVPTGGIHPFSSPKFFKPCDSFFHFGQLHTHTHTGPTFSFTFFKGRADDFVVLLFCRPLLTFRSGRHLLQYFL